MFKVNKIHVFLIAIMAAFLSGSFAHAQNSDPGSVIILSSEQNDYNLNDQVFIYEDYDARKTVQDMTQLYSEGRILFKNKDPDRVTLDQKSYPYWLIFTAFNNTDQEKWVLDIGELGDGRAGVAKKFLIYEMNRGQIYYDGFQVSAKNNPVRNNSRYIPITFPKGQKSAFVVYILPSEYKRVSLDLALSKTALDTNVGIAKAYAEYIPAIILISFTILLFAFILTREFSLIPLIIFYGLYYLWFTQVEEPFYAPILGLGAIASFYPIFNACLIVTATLLAVPRENSGSSVFHTSLIALTAFTTSVACLLIFFLSVETLTQSLLLYLSSIGLLTVSIFYIFSNKNHNNQLFLFSVVAWIVVYIVGQAIKITYLSGVIEPNFINAHSEYISLLPQIFIIFTMAFLIIKKFQSENISLIVSKVRKEKSLLQAKKAKNDNDHSKLLRVIEREREVMEELRNRETERAEEMREAKQSADEANEAKSAFLAVVSHEIRTPMTGIMGMVRLLEESNPTQQQEEYIMTIRDSGDAMLSLLNDILDFSKIESGGLQLEETVFDLKRVLNGIEMLMRGHAEQKGIKLIINIHDEIPSNLIGDPTRLRQVILNFVGNALKFTSKGQVRIGAYLDTNQQVKSKDECAVYFFIEDTGIGISEEAQKELFTPFKQADDTINRKYGGTGLGLSICKRLIEAMGSEINVRSREGFGSTFYFTLLFNVHEEQDSVEASPESNNAYKEENKPASVDNEISQNQSRTYSSGKKGRDLRILVVDDNEVNRKVVKAFLDKEDHETVMIHSGKEALSLLQHDNRFHAILLDIEMPDMNGKDVARAILKDKLLNHIPIIALTGNISESDLELYERIGFAGCVAKPIVPEDMLDIINSASSDIYSKQAANKMDESEEIIINEESSVRHDSDAVDKITDEAIKQSPPIPQQDTNVGKTLDEKMVKGLRDGLGIQQSKELLAELFTKAEDIIDGIDRAIQEDKLNEIHMRAHELKGMAGNFGLKAISDKATQLENLCKDNKITAGECVTHKEDLKNLLERSEIAINNYFKDE